MIIAITGHVRKRPKETFAEQYERILVMIETEMEASRFSVSRIACGRKNGVDRAAIMYAKSRGLPYDHYPIRYSLVSHADALLVFDDGSRTTRDVINQMSREGKLVHRVGARSDRKPSEESSTSGDATGEPQADEAAGEG